MSRCLFPLSRKFVIVGHALTVMFLSTIAMATEVQPIEKREKVDFILDTLHISQQIATVFDSNLTNLAEKFRSKNPNMTDDQYASIKLVLVNMREKYKSDILQIYESVWSNVFSDEEIGRYYDFLQTQEGHDMIAKQRTVMDTELKKKINYYNTTTFYDDLNVEIKSVQNINQLNAINAQDMNIQSTAPLQKPVSNAAAVKPLDLMRFAPSGVKQRIANVTLVDPDCTSAGIAVPRIVEKPANGNLEFVKGDAIGNWSIGTSRDKCSDKRYPSLLLYYTSKPEYIGADGFKLLLLFPDGTASEWDVIIGVK